MSVLASEDRPDHGFTLLELLVALALTAVIGTTMAIAITQLRPMRAFEERLNHQQIASTLADVIARDLKSAQRLPLMEAGDNSSTLLVGDPQKVTFTAVVPTGFQRRGLREVTYELAKEGDGRTRLLRTIRLRRFTQQEKETETQSEELCSESCEVSFNYLKFGYRGDETWQDQFSEVNRLPAGVAVLVELGKKPSRIAVRTASYVQVAIAP